MAEDLLLDPVPRDAALDLPVTCALEAGVLLRGVEGSTAAAACSRMKGTTCFNSWRRCSAEDVRAVGSWAHHRPNAAAMSAKFRFVNSAHLASLHGRARVKLGPRALMRPTSLGGGVISVRYIARFLHELRAYGVRSLRACAR